MTNDAQQPASAVLKDLERQAGFCRDLNSEFTAQLLEHAAADFRHGGIVAQLTGGWPPSAKADAVALRLAGALHAAALTGRDEDLASRYPDRDPDWSMERVWPLAEAFLTRDEAWVRDFIKSPPQTNETARSTGLAAGFLWLAAQSPQPFHMLEIGASAGLNLHWDKFNYLKAGWPRGGSGPAMPTQVAGPTPAWRDIAIASRAACDVNPLDVAKAEDRLRLRAYVWADQTARIERLEAAIELALAQGVHVEKADAAAFLRAKLGEGLKPGTTVVYHSVFLQYPPRDVRIAIAETIERAGRLADDAHRLAWVRFEPEGVIGGPRDSVRFVLSVICYGSDGRRDRTLADVDPHGRTMSWLG